jgi:ArsR family transcriptional regulator
MEYAFGIFFALSDPIRLRSLALLGNEGELCVCELTHALQASQPQISKHMATLRDAGLVRDRRDAQWVLYSLAPDLPLWVKEAVAAAMKGVSEEAIHTEDVERLKGMLARPSRNRAA